MDFTTTPKPGVKLSTPEESKESKEAISSTKSEKQASTSTCVNDAINTHGRQQRTEPLRDPPSKNIKTIGPACDDQSRYDLKSDPLRMFYFINYNIFYRKNVSSCH